LSRASCTLAALLGLSTACASGPKWQSPPHHTYFTREPTPVLHPLPESGEPSEAIYLLDQSVVRPVGSLVGADRLVTPEPALDVNDFGHVHDSTWFTNRITRRPLTAEQMRIGPNTINGPAPGPLTVISGKIEGVTPGFEVRDSLGRRFLVKLDHPAYPTLSSGAEVVATKLLWAAGYNVPENYIVTFDLDRLQLAPNATTRGRYDAEVPLTEEALQGILSNANPYPDGSIRALFSRIIEGEPVGPFEYDGVREDDPNDRIPHERRRSLRGLRYIFAWLNNTDPRASNSLDVFIASESNPRRGFLKHYLLDFGDAFGASGTEPKYLAEGYEHLVDLEAMAIGGLSFGIHYRYWLPVRRSPLRSVGTYESEVFTPQRWKPAIPNPAFQACDEHDRYWAASMISRFTPELLGAAVDTGAYTEPGARDYMLVNLLRRQTQILEAGFAGFLPLEDLIVRGLKVGLTDRAVAADLLDPEHVRYRYAIFAGSPDQPAIVEGIHPRPWADLEPALQRVRTRAEYRRRPYLVVRFRRETVWGEQSPPFDLRVRIQEGRVLPVGFDRSPD